MFLSDALQEILDTAKTPEEVVTRINDEMISRMQNPYKVGTMNYINSLRQLDASYRLFCKDCKILNPDWFRNKVIRCIPEDVKEEILKLLKW